MAKISEWANDIMYSDDVVTKNKVVGLYGFTGSGKTHLIGTFPNPFVLNFEKKPVTLRKLHIPFYQFEKSKSIFTKVLYILDDIASGEVPKLKNIKTLGIDSFMELANFLLYEIMRKDNRNPEEINANYGDYTKLAAQMDTIVKKAQNVGLNIVMTAGVKEEKDDLTGEIIASPNLIGSFRRIFGHQCNELYFLEAEENKDETIYKLYTSKHRRYDAKSEFGLTGVYKNASYEKLYGKDDEETSTSTKKKK